MERYAQLLTDAGQGLGDSSGAANAIFDFTVIVKILAILGDEDLTRFQKIIRILPLILTLFAT